MFRRRRADAGQPEHEPQGAGPACEWQDAAGEAGPGMAGRPARGTRARTSPTGSGSTSAACWSRPAEGFEVQVSVVEDQPAWITVMRGDSGLQLQAFAAPKSGGLWDEVRQEIAAEVARSGGQSIEADGPFGVELRRADQPRRPGPRRPPAVRWSRSGSWAWTARAGSCAASSAARRPAMRTRPGRWSRCSRTSSWSAAIIRSRPGSCWRSGCPRRRCRRSARQPPEPEEGRWPLNPFERGPEITETR